MPRLGCARVADENDARLRLGAGVLARFPSPRRARTQYLTFGLALSAAALIAWCLATWLLLVEAVANDPPEVLEGVMPGVQAVTWFGGW